MYRLETPTGELLASNISTKELREITGSATVIIDVFDEESGEFMGEFDPERSKA